MENRQNGSNKNPNRGGACGGSGAIGSGSKSAVRTPGEQQRAAHDEQQQREDNRQPWNQRGGRPRTLYTAHGQGRGQQFQQRFQNPRTQFHRDNRKSYSSVNTPSPRHIFTGQRFECPPNLPPEKKVKEPRPLASSYAAAAAMGTQYDPERHGQSSGTANVSVASHLRNRSASVSGSQRSLQIQKHKHTSPEKKSSSVKKQKLSESNKQKEEQVIQILQRDERIKKKQEEALTLEKLQNLADKQHVIDSDVDRAVFGPEAEELIEIDTANSKSDKAMPSASSKSNESIAPKSVQKRSEVVIPEGSGAARMLVGLSGQLFNVNAPEFVPPKQISGKVTTVENVPTVVTAKNNEFESLKQFGNVTKVTVNVEGKKEPGIPETTLITSKVAKVYLTVNEQTREQLEAAENESDSSNDNERDSSVSESETEQSEGSPRQKRRKTMKDIAANWKERRPTTAVLERHIGEGKRINQKAKYLVVDAGPEYGIGLKTINSPGEAPDFIYIFKGKDTTNWSELHHGFWVYTKEFNRRLMDDGTPMKEKTRAMQLDDLITVIPSQIAGKPNTEIFEPSWIVTNFTIQSNTTRNLLLEWPTYVLNNMRAKPTVKDTEYKLQVEVVAGFMSKAQTLGNNRISMEFTRSNLIQRGQVMGMDAYKVQANQWLMLGQCLIPEKAMFAGQLPVVEENMLKIERVYPITQKCEQALSVLGGTGRPIATVDEFERMEKFYKGGVLLHIGASIHLEKREMQQSQVYVTIATDKDQRTGRMRPLLHDNHRTVFRKDFDDQVEGSIAKARAQRLKEGNTIIVRKAPNNERPKKGEPPSYVTTDVVWSGILVNTKTRFGQPWEFDAHRGIYTNAIARELKRRDRKRTEEEIASKKVAELNLNSDEEKAKKKEEILKSLRKAAEQDIKEQEKAAGFRLGTKARMEDLSEEQKKQRESENALGATDELYFKNRQIDARTLLVLSADETKSKLRHVRKAFEAFDSNLKAKTYAGKIGCFLAGIQKLPYTSQEYELAWAKDKLQWYQAVKEAGLFVKSSILEKLGKELEADLEGPENETEEEKEERISRLSLRLNDAHSLEDTYNQIIIADRVTRETEFQKVVAKNMKSYRKLDERQLDAIGHLSQGKNGIIVNAAAGGGKTVTITEMIMYLLAARDSEVICATAEQNLAVLGIVDMLAVSVAAATKENLPDHSVFLVRSTSAEMKTPIASGVMKRIGKCLLRDHLLDILKLPTSNSPDGLNQERKQAIRKYLEVSQEDEFAITDTMAMIRYVLRYSTKIRVVALTIANLTVLRHVMPAKVLLVDEAGQAVIDDIRAIVRDSKIEQLVAVGDRLQLEPFTDFELKGKAYSFRQASLMTVGCENIVNVPAEDFASVTLNRTHRFEKHIREVASFACYEEFAEKLIGPENVEMDIQKAWIANSGFPFPKKGVPIILYHVPDKMAQSKEGVMHNPVQREAALRIHELLAYHMRQWGPGDLCTLKGDTIIQCYYTDEANKVIADLKKKNSLLASRTTVATVNSFQGQERDCNIIITTKSERSKNERIDKWFVTDDRSFTTACTRGGKCLVIIGNFDTLPELFYGPVARLIAKCREMGIKIVGIDWLNYINTNMMEGGAINTNVDWKYDDDGTLVDDDGKDFGEDTWPNKKKINLVPTPKSRLTSCWVPRPNVGSNDAAIPDEPSSTVNQASAFANQGFGDAEDWNRQAGW